MTCLCGRDVAKRPGHPVEIGDIVGSGIEPGMRYGRVVGFIKKPQRGISGAKTVIREFRPGDGRWPTGDYIRAWLFIPWYHDHPQTELGAWQEPLDWHHPAKFGLPAKVGVVA